MVDQLDETLQETVAHLSLLLNQLPGYVWTTDSQLRFTSLHGAGLRGVGLKSGELVGTTLYKHFGKEDKSFPPIAAHLQALMGESTSYEQRSGVHFH